MKATPTAIANKMNLRALTLLICTCIGSLTACSDAIEGGAADAAQHSDSVMTTDDEPPEEDEAEKVDPCPGGFFSGSQCVFLNPDIAPNDQNFGSPLAGSLHIVNATRTQEQRCGGIPVAAAESVRLDLALIEAAQAHAESMAADGAVDAWLGENESAFDRARAAGFEGDLMLQNYGTGFAHSAEAVDAWMEFKPTCEHIMADVTHTGIGHARGADGVSYWSLIMAR